MKRVHPPTTTQPAAAPNRRAGTTLSEVLISLLVMSVGVVSLATLFPISVLRSVQAHQLTSATNLRYNVEAMLSVMPQLYSIGAPWDAAISYSAGDLVTPTELTSLKSPPVVFECITAGTSGGTEPNWNFNDGATTSGDGAVEWKTYRVQNYVIDPLGQWSVESPFRLTGTGNFFGNDGGNPPTVRAVNGFGRAGIRAFGGIGANSVNDNIAAEAATSPDTWINNDDAESFAVTYASGALTATLGDMKFDMTQTVPASTTAALSRVVFYDATGKLSETRPISAIGALSGSSQTIGWPAGGLTITPVRARIETRERRFSWLLSVRRGFSGASFMEVVVFFRRPFSGKDEQLYPATFHAKVDPGYDQLPGIANYNDDDPNGLDASNSTDDDKELGYIGSDDTPRNWVVVQYNDAQGKPFMKKGGYVTDADNLRWYRILDVVENDLVYSALYSNPVEAVMRKAGLNTSNPYLKPDALDTASGMTHAILLKIENKIVQDGPAPSGGFESGGVPTGRAMMMRGIVDVYPIRTHLTWEE